MSVDAFHKISLSDDVSWLWAEGGVLGPAWAADQLSNENWQIQNIYMRDELDITAEPELREAFKCLI